MTQIFDDPTAYIVFAGGLATVLLLIWRGTDAKPALYGALAALCVVGGLVAADLMVETDREYLESTVERIATELEHKNLTTFLALLDNDYRGYGGSKAGLTKMANSRIKSTLIDSITIKDCEIEVKDDVAKMDVTTRVMPGGSLKGSRVLVKMTIRWQKRPVGGWVVVGASKPNFVMPFGQ